MYGTPHKATWKSLHTKTSRMQWSPSGSVAMVRTTASTDVSLPLTPRTRTSGDLTMTEA